MTFPSSSLYQNLLSLYQSEPDNWPTASLHALPDSFREQIVCKIRSQNQCPDIPQYGDIHVFHSLPKLRSAVSEVTANVLQSLPKRIEDQIASKTWDLVGKPVSEDANNWGENHAADDTPLLLKIMDDSLGFLTPDFLKSLDNDTDLFTIIDVVNAFGAIEQQERGSVSKATAHLCEQLNITDLSTIIDVVDAFGAIEEQERTSISEATAHLCEQLNITDNPDMIIRVVYAFRAIEEQERTSIREATAHLCEQLDITDLSTIIHVIKAFGAIKEQERTSMSEATVDLCKRLNITDRLQIKDVFNAFGAIKQQGQASVGQATGPFN